MPEDEDIPMPREEIETGVEESLGHPLPGPASERLTAITKRIEYLEDQIQRATNNGLEIPDRVRNDLTEARKQLAEWQAQKEGRN